MFTFSRFFSGGNNAVSHVSDAAEKFNSGPDIFTFKTNTQLLGSHYLCSFLCLFTSKDARFPCLQCHPPLLANFCQVHVRSCCSQSHHPCCTAMKFVHYFIPLLFSLLSSKYTCIQKLITVRTLLP